MANVNKPFGLKPVGHLLGLDWSSQVRKCSMTGASGACYIGDPIVLAGSADATGVYPTIAPATMGATYPILGVVVGFEPDPTDLTILYRKNSTDRTALVLFDPFVIYEVQADVTAVIAKESVGANCVFVNAAGGSTTTGLSGVTIASTTTPAATATYQALILSAASDPKNDISAVYARWLVVISLHTFNAVWQVDTGGSAAYAGQKGA